MFGLIRLSGFPNLPLRNSSHMQQYMIGVARQCCIAGKYVPLWCVEVLGPEGDESPVSNNQGDT